MPEVVEWTGQAYLTLLVVLPLDVHIHDELDLARRLRVGAAPPRQRGLIVTWRTECDLQVRTSHTRNRGCCRERVLDDELRLTGTTAPARRPRVTARRAESSPCIRRSRRASCSSMTGTRLSTSTCRVAMCLCASRATALRCALATRPCRSPSRTSRSSSSVASSRAGRVALRICALPSRRRASRVTTSGFGRAGGIDWQAPWAQVVAHSARMSCALRPAQGTPRTEWYPTSIDVARPVAGSNERQASIGSA